MLNCINQNPFRIYGAYSNSALKEITANKSRISAYAKVGKAITFPLDAVCGLQAVVRTPESIESAEHQLALAQNKLNCALFWFAKDSSIDEMAIEYLLKGDQEKAKELLQKKATATSLVNLSVIGLIQNNYRLALESIHTLVKSAEMHSSFVTLICGEAYTIEPFDLWKSYIAILLQETNAQNLLNAVPSEGKDAEWEYVEEQAVAEPIKQLKEEIQKTEERLKNASADEAYEHGIRLMNEAKKRLLKIKGITGNKDLKYVNIADSSANQILQCSINYFNETDEEDSVDKALRLAEYALSIAEGSLVTNRCKKNIEILKSKKEESNISIHIENIKQLLEKFSKANHSISNANQFVEDCLPHLEKISAALGTSNELYIKISSAIAMNAMGMAVKVINENPKSTSLIYQGIELFQKLEKLDVDEQTKTRITVNNATLSINLSNIGQEQPNLFKSCLIKIIIYIVVLLLIALISQI